jgi:hypothetical protein
MAKDYVQYAQSMSMLHIVRRVENSRVEGNAKRQVHPSGVIFIAQSIYKESVLHCLFE